MSIRIYSKKAFAIGPGANRSGSVESFITVPMAFQDMPDQYKDDPTFKLAVKSGDITIITSGEAGAKAEVKAQNETPQDTPVQSATEAFYEELKVMKAEDTKALGQKLGVDPVDGEKMGQYKKRVFEAWKLANAEGTSGDEAAE